MTAMPPEIQWYIARDGKQYGPLSEPEMKLFVDGGHLKPTDLVWRPGFSDWTPAMAAFPAIVPPQPTAPPAGYAGPGATNGQIVTQPAPSSAQAVRSATTAGGNASDGLTTEPRSAQAPAAAAGPTHQRQPSWSAASEPDPGLRNGEPGASVSPMASAMAAGATRPSSATTTQSALAPAGSATVQREPTAGTAARSMGSGRPDAEAGRSVIGVEPGFPGDDTDDAGGTSRSRAFTVGLVATALLLAGGGGWLAYRQQDAIKSFFARSGGISSTAQAFTVGAGPAEAIDGRLQRTALWSNVKREFPHWYEERIKETAKLAAEKKPDAAMAKYLLESLVALRRKHANDALAASPAKLVNVAQAFLGNLKRISSESTSACYSFISQGEASPAVVDLLQKPETHQNVQAQLTAVFEAIADGRKTQTKHTAPDKSDYDALAEQLTRLGWSQADLQLFADPRALARTSHDRVCKMVQDWFSAHIAVKDQGAQERLLVETLRPVVAG